MIDLKEENSEILSNEARNLADLLKKGIISLEEYEKRKSILLSNAFDSLESSDRIDHGDGSFSKRMENEWNVVSKNKWGFWIPLAHFPEFSCTHDMNYSRKYAQDSTR